MFLKAQNVLLKAIVKTLKMLTCCSQYRKKSEIQNEQKQQIFHTQKCDHLLLILSEIGSSFSDGTVERHI